MAGHEIGYRLMLPEESVPGDLVIRSPRAVYHGVTCSQGEDDPENYVTLSAEDRCWYAPSEDGRLEYVSKDWVSCWFLRAGYFGLAAMLERRTLGKKGPRPCLPNQETKSMSRISRG